MARAFLPHAALDAAQLEAEGGVAQGRGPGQEGEVLEHEGALGPGPGDLAPVDQHLARAGLEQARDDLEQGRLAAARGAQQGGELAVLEGEVDATQRLDHAEGLADPARLDDRLGRGGLGERHPACRHHACILCSGRNRAVSSRCRPLSTRAETMTIERMTAYISG